MGSLAGSWCLLLLLLLHPELTLIASHVAYLGRWIPQCAKPPNLRCSYPGPEPRQFSSSVGRWVLSPGTAYRRQTARSCCPNILRLSPPWVQPAWEQSCQRRTQCSPCCSSSATPAWTPSPCSWPRSPPSAPAQTSQCLAASPQPERAGPCPCFSARQCVSSSTPPAAPGTSVLAEHAA